MDTKLRIAIQKKGRLFDESFSLMRECGISVKPGYGKLMAAASNFPLEVLFLRDDDIPKYVEEGVADIGIAGENVVLEKGHAVEVVDHLGFAGCRMSLAIPREEAYPGLSYFEGKKIATSYPFILAQYLREKGIKAEIEEISGSVEIAPGIGLAAGILDIVSSGSTLRSNGLKEVEVILKSEAVLMATPGLEGPKRALLDKLLFRIGTARNAKANKYILLNAPNQAIPAIRELIPGMKAPTVLPLAEEGWSSLHSVVREDDFWAVIDELRALGAQGILVVPIEKMVL